MDRLQESLASNLSNAEGNMIDRMQAEREEYMYRAEPFMTGAIGSFALGTQIKDTRSPDGLFLIGLNSVLKRFAG